VTFYSFRSRYAALVLLVIWFDYGLCGCSARLPKTIRRGAYGTSNMSAHSFDEISRVAGWADDQPSLFPELRIYNASGRLVYQNHDGGRNARMLRGLPATIHELSPIANARPLEAAKQAFPEFRSLDPEVTNHAEATIVSIMLGGCHGCEVQDQAVSTEHENLLKNNVNVFLVYVSGNKQ